MSNTKTLFSSISNAFVKHDAEKANDIILTKKSLIKWIQKYNKKAIAAGYGKDQLVHIFDTDGTLLPSGLRKGFELYNSFYIANRQPVTMYRNAKTGITVTSDEPRFTMKTKTRTYDPIIPSVGRAEKEADEYNEDVIGAYDIVKNDGVRKDF